MINNISAECVPASQCRQYEGDGKRLGEAQRLNLETSYWSEISRNLQLRLQGIHRAGGQAGCSDLRGDRGRGGESLLF